MYKTNSIIVTEGNKVGFLGTKIYSFLNLKMKTPFAYPDGTFNKGDLVIYIDFNCKALTSEEKEALKKIGIKLNEIRSQMINIGIYDNCDIQNIQKNIEINTSIRANVQQYIMVNTFFNGNKIAISYGFDNKSINIDFNGQLISADIGDYSNALFCFNDDGVKYFNYSKENRIIELEKVLKGQLYPGHSIIKDYFQHKVYLKDIFNDEFICILQKAKGYAGFMMAEYNNENFYIFTNKLKINEESYYQYFINRKQDFLSDMNLDTNFYRHLVKADFRLSNNTLASSFRLWGQDEALLKVKMLLQKACVTGITILLTGESGTGKTFLAKEIHQNSRRSKEPFIHVNCAAIPYQLIESELFGYEEGSFTGAKKGGKKGYFELAQNGTIFLDEITEMPLPLQGKLLEVIQNKTFYRVGGSEKININVRLIVATNRNLKKLVSQKEFREDLYYRINVFPVELPPLRSRKNAIMEIINDVLPEICDHIEIEPLVVSGEAMEKLKQYNWPGNIRELENVLAKAAIMCDGKVIMPEDIELQEDDLEDNNGDYVIGTYKEQKAFYDKKIILEALKKCKGHKIKTAQYLGIGRTSLFEKIRKYGVETFEDNLEE